MKSSSDTVSSDAMAKRTLALSIAVSVGTLVGIAFISVGDFVVLLRDGFGLSDSEDIVK